MNDIWFRIVLLLAFSIGCVSSTESELAIASMGPPPDVVITMDSSGHFSPQHVQVASGQAVKWVLYRRDTDAVARVTATTWPAVCSSTATYGSVTPELTGPMRRAQSGIFTLGPELYGYKVTQLAEMTIATPDNLCPVTGNVGIPLDAANPGAGPYLCEQTGDPAYLQKSLDAETWGSGYLTGVFVKLRWIDVNPTQTMFDWTALDREIGRAVANNKLYSIAVSAGEDSIPTWIYSAVPAVGQLTLDANEQQDRCRNKTYANVTDPDYAIYYDAMLTALAAHLKTNADWYRRLAYIKPSGANNTTAENRLPNGCKATAGANCGGVPSCNDKAWVDVGYTPAGLYAFYDAVEQTIAAQFPDKSMSYALIQAGFPRANAAGGSGCYVDASGASSCVAPFTVPGGTEQTVTILDQFRNRAGVPFGVEATVQHNGLGWDPPCTMPGTTADGCPNWWAYHAGANHFSGTSYGQVIGYQTNNAGEVATPLDLHHTFQNGWNNSSATFFEIYETVHWRARYMHNGIINYGQGEPAQTIGGWRDMLTNRRNTMFPTTALPSTSPAEHRVVFTSPVGVQTKHYFINPAGTTCASSSAAWGSVTVGGP